MTMTFCEAARGITKMNGKFVTGYADVCLSCTQQRIALGTPAASNEKTLRAPGCFT